MDLLFLSNVLTDQKLIAYRFIVIAHQTTFTFFFA